MEDEALVWFQDIEEASQFTSWDAFVRALHIRFGDSAYDDPMESLTKLRQVGSISTYKTQFEVLSNRIKELSERHKLSCFLSELKDEIRLLVRMLNPKNFSFAFGLAKIQEEYLFTSKKITKPWIDIAKPSIVGPPLAFKNDNIDPKITKFPIQKLPTSQIEERRKKGVCFHCEEKYHAGHQCKSPMIFLMEGLVRYDLEFQVTEMSIEGEDQLEVYVDTVEGTTAVRKVHADTVEGIAVVNNNVAEITLYALLGSPSPGTMRVLGRIKHREVVILINSGSTQFSRCVYLVSFGSAFIYRGYL